MPSPFPNLSPEQRGKLRCLDHSSRALRGNPWGDPTHRDLWVYTPPGYDHEPDRRYPAVLLLAPYAGTGESMLARGLTEVSIGARIDRLIVEEGCPPFLAVLPDAMSSLGGTQYVDSPGIGAYATWLMREILPFVEGRLRTSGRWGVAGRSSGGFGALHLAMSYPGRFSAVASHAGDMGFDLAYLAELPAAVAPLQAAGGPRAFVRDFWGRPTGGSFAALSLLCLSAAYDPVGALTLDGFPGRLPFDLRTGAVDFDTFIGWGRFDPVRRAAEGEAQAALGALELLFLDAGDRDEHHLHLGLRRFTEALRVAGIPHVAEEFPGGHRGTSGRFDRSLPALARCLSG